MNQTQEAILAEWDRHEHAPGGPRRRKKVQGSASDLAKRFGVSRGYVLRLVYDRRQRGEEPARKGKCEPSKPRLILSACMED